MEKKSVVGIRLYLSRYHLWSSWFLAQKAKTIEINFKQEELLEKYIEHRAYVLSSVINTVSFLETHINEFYSDISESLFINYKGIQKSKARLISNLWKRGIPRTAKYSILDKYEIALDLFGNENFNSSKYPYQDVKSLIKLRNTLVHQESEWIYTSGSKIKEKDLTHRIEKSLKGKFDLNPLAGKGNMFFPDKCLSNGCANWAIKCSIDFVIKFYQKCKIKVSEVDYINKIKQKINDSE